MAWQQCPVCKGTGCDPFIGAASTSFPKCPVCKGTRIIDEKTGKPPDIDVKFDRGIPPELDVF